MLRLILAGLFVLIGVLSEEFFFNSMYPKINPFELEISGPWITFLIVAAYFIFKERSPWVKKDGAMKYRRREDLVSEIYHARRALELRDLGTGDGWYLIELDTGKVLSLWDNQPSGPLGFDSGNPEVRHFPCTEFTVLRHSVENFIADVICAGEVIKPVTVPVPDHFDDWLYTHFPKDGEVVPDKSFDEMQAEVQKIASGSNGGGI